MYGLTLGQMSRLHRSLCASRRCATARLPTISRRRCRVRPNHSKNRRIVANNKVAFSPYQSSKSHKNGSIVLLYGPFRRIYGLGRVKLPCPYILRVLQKKEGILKFYFCGILIAKEGFTHVIQFFNTIIKLLLSVAELPFIWQILELSEFLISKAHVTTFKEAWFDLKK